MPRSSSDHSRRVPVKANPSHRRAKGRQARRTLPRKKRKQNMSNTPPRRSMKKDLPTASLSLARCLFPWQEAPRPLSGNHVSETMALGEDTTTMILDIGCTATNFSDVVFMITVRVVADMAFYTLYWVTFWNLHGVKVMPTDRATPWPNRAETAVKLFKSQYEKLPVMRRNLRRSSRMWSLVLYCWTSHGLPESISRMSSRSFLIAASIKSTGS